MSPAREEIVSHFLSKKRRRAGRINRGAEDKTGIAIDAGGDVDRQNGGACSVDRLNGRTRLTVKRSAKPCPEKRIDDEARARKNIRRKSINIAAE